MFALRVGRSARFARWPVPENEHAKWAGVLAGCRQPVTKNDAL